jgi:hypothetical protein
MKHTVPDMGAIDDSSCPGKSDSDEPAELPLLPDRIENWGEFRATILSAARHSVAHIGAAACLDLSPKVEDILAAVLRGHMVRLYKFFDAYVVLLENNRRDPATSLCRTMMEILVNLDFILSSDDPPLRARAFVARSVDFMLEPTAYLSDQILRPADPSDISDEEFEEFSQSVMPLVDLQSKAAGVLQRSGLISTDEHDARACLDGACRELLKSWPRSIRQRATGPLALNIYHKWFEPFSLSVHPNWVKMEEQDLWRGDGTAAQLESVFSDENEILDPFGWTVATAARYAEIMDGREAHRVAERLESILGYVTAASELMHREY